MKKKNFAAVMSHKFEEYIDFLLYPNDCILEFLEEETPMKMKLLDDGRLCGCGINWRNELVENQKGPDVFQMFNSKSILLHALLHGALNLSFLYQVLLDY